MQFGVFVLAELDSARNRLMCYRFGCFHSAICYCCESYYHLRTHSVYCGMHLVASSLRSTSSTFLHLFLFIVVHILVDYNFNFDSGIGIGIGFGFGFGALSYYFCVYCSSIQLFRWQFLLLSFVRPLILIFLRLLTAMNFGGIPPKCSTDAAPAAAVLCVCFEFSFVFSVLN